MTNSQKDRKYIWHPYTQMAQPDLPITIVKGKGTMLYDDNGKAYIDAISSWWVNVHGHSHPYIADKIAKQALTLEHSIFAGFTHAPAVQLAEKLLRKLPINQSKVFFSDNGSTAVEVAIKMAAQYWYNKGEKKKKIIAFENAYHGDTFGAMSVSGRSTFTKPFNDMLFEVIFIPVPIKGKERLAQEALEKALKQKDVAAFLFEPLVQGTAGMLMYEPEALDQLLYICKKHEVLAIADEVMTGFGRTGKFFASDYLREQPDIFCLSKGITGGFMALGVTTCTLQIYNAFLDENHPQGSKKTFFHGHSYTANPIACTAANASLEVFDKENTLEKIDNISLLHAQFAEEIKHNNLIKNIRYKGTILAIEFVTNQNSGYFNSIKEKLYNFYISEGVLLRPLGNLVYILPPYCITEKELAAVYRVIKASLELLKV